MFVEGCRPGLAPGVSGIHFAVLSSNIATAQERTCHEGRRGAWDAGGAHRWRMGESQDDGRTGTLTERTRAKDAENRGQIARTDNLAGMHASVLMTSREHSDETGQNGRTHVHTHTTRACSHGDKVPVEGAGCKARSNGTSEVLFDRVIRKELAILPDWQSNETRSL